ncbi:hypothetical protein QJS04_geneDACA019556 [Acorus gramineus]|uniref:Metallo-beta-lactamase domain-containing protein n=1 Tax=Acorus gramineus TaxID=55184 RepID=A0AAV9AEY7_ACOGR|nr:hypothetical protein QJS04_geneDACA019556 [Acorus gramineus]
MAPETFKRIDGFSAVSKQPSCQEERLKALQGIYHCGYHSERTYGATSYVIVHPEGNILVDSPRYTERLAGKIEALGGARYMFLTHRDDVGDHDKWSKRLRCDRILHSKDVEVSTADVEMQLYGDGPWDIGTHFELIHTPGHTRGSVCLFYKPLKVLFTGDHLANTPESTLTISEEYNQVSGHDRRVKYRDVQEKNSALKAFLASKIQYSMA